MLKGKAHKKFWGTIIRKLEVLAILKGGGGLLKRRGANSFTLS